MGDQGPLSGLGLGAYDPVHAKFRRVTRLNVAIRRQLGEQGDELRADVLADLKDALTADGPTLEMIAVEGVPEPQLFATTEGLYRLILVEFGLDGSDGYLQESWFEWVRRDLDEVLAEGGGAFHQPER